MTAATKCAECGGKLDPTLVALGYKTHPPRSGEDFPICSSKLDNLDDDVLIGKEISDEVARVIKDYAANIPRTLQKTLGPSEIGHPCDRQIAYKLLDWPAVNTDQDPWPSLVGTAVHALLDKVFSDPKHGGIYATELTVESPRNGGSGHTDIYFLLRKTVNDWKIVGPTSMREYKSHGPSRGYRVQAHIYGHGLAAKGIPVERVSITFLPRGGYLSGRYVWTERYDPSIAEEAFTRVDLIEQLVDALMPAVDPSKFELIAATPDHCDWCPFYSPGSTDLGKGCPGSGEKPTAVSSVESLIA